MTISLICAQQDRVESLLFQSRQGRNGATQEDQVWLASHLRDCVSCNGKAEAAAAAVEELHTFSSQTLASRALVRNTQLQVRFRAAQMRQQQERMMPLWLGVSLVALWAVGSLPLVWSGFEFMSQSFSWPAHVWQGGAVVAWLMPTGLLTSFAVSLRRERELQG
ncbi:MAG: hypothetical protein HYX26_06350 [Acidobacteriales bacterium]|nr:hypothetical protein [Terriglobales bacterium]